MELNGLKINVLGDSITEGAGASEPGRVYWALLASRDGAVVRGYGIGGTRIARQHKPTGAPYDQHFGTRVDAMDGDADVVVVFGGTNDHGHGDAPLGHFADTTDDTFYGALHCLYRSLIHKYPRGRIVVMTPLHRTGENDLFNADGVRNVGTLADYVRIIKEVAGYYALPVLDLYHTSGMQPEIPILHDCYNPDGLHPNDAGHERIYQLLRGFLLQL